MTGRKKFLYLAQTLEDGAVEDIWYAADEFEENGFDSPVGRKIERTQEAMQEAAEILRKLSALWVFDDDATVEV